MAARKWLLVKTQTFVETILCIYWRERAVDPLHAHSAQMRRCRFVNFVDVHKQPRKSFKVMGYCPQASTPINKPQSQLSTPDICSLTLFGPT